MQTVFSTDHELQSVATELFRGRRIEALEIPRRAQLVHAQVLRADLGPVRPPDPFDLAPILAVHDAGFVDFLATFWPRWVAEVGDIPACPNVWPPRRSA